MTAQLAKPVEILMVEDNPGDVRLAQEALAEGKIHNSLYVVRDGVEAMDFLKQRNGYADAPRPDIILLDLNLPKKSGMEVLQEVKGDDSLKSIPVVVLTSSESQEDVARSYGLHANCYVTKPVDLDQFLLVVRTLEEFWLSIVKLPRS